MTAPDTDSNPDLDIDTSRQSATRLLLILGLGVLAVIGGSMLYWFTQNQPSTNTAPQFNGSIPSQRIPLPEFSLIDTKEQTFTNANLQEQWSLLFFGFTSCPDICPNTLAEIKAAQLNNVQVVLVSADPERDLPSRLGSYLRYYDPAFVGVTGEQSAVEAFTRGIGVPVTKVPLNEGNYTVDHSASLWLIDPQGQIAAKLSYPHNGEALQQTVPALINYLN